MADSIQRPIFVVGTHRSGTTLLGRALARHPEVTYLEEPRHIWSRGHNFRSDDVLGSADATPRTSARIYRQIERAVTAGGRPRLVEKTPSNCLRLPFLYTLFPDAFFVHIFRDGRAVVHSTALVTAQRIPEPARWLPRLLGTPLWEWPAFLPRAWRTLGQRLLGRQMSFWGPRPPRWQQWVKHDSRWVILAKQWRYTLEAALDFRDSQASAHWLDIRYEDLLKSPVHHARQILRFAQLAESRDFEQQFELECDPDRADIWRTQLDLPTLDELRPVLEPPLIRLGYDY